MPVPRHLLDAIGHWTGTSKLHLSWLPEDRRVEESASTLTVSTDLKQTFATIDTTWSTEGDEQAGRMVLSARDGGEISAGWADSWHQNTSVMFLVGHGTDGPIKVTGAYKAPEGPNWGWRIEIELTGPDTLQHRMVNITPDGEEEWAVQGDYRRV